jgi:hypothetical protein
MAAKRKIFITHAGELAHRLMRAVERDGLVAEFVRAYAGRYGRRKLLTEPARLHELERTMGREALLAMTVEIRRLLPRAFASGPGGALRPEEATLCDAFYAEFVASLERALEWDSTESATESGSFERDLEMYRQWSNRSAAPSRAAESPFPDRCAILLDPAMMEQARHAGAGFEVELASAAAKMLGRLGRDAVRPARKFPHKAKKTVPATKKAQSRTGEKNNKKRDAVRTGKDPVQGVSKPTNRLRHPREAGKHNKRRTDR